MQQQVSETLRRMGAVGCLELLGHALVTVPYWDWDGCKGPGEREQYLRGKLAVYKDRVQ